MGEIAGALIGGIGAFMQYGAAEQANQIAYMNLQFQKQMANKQFDLASAGHTDAYGNKTSYNKLTHEWETTLTPMQQAMIKAQEREQYMRMTHDAEQEREVRDQQFKRGEVAKEDYNTALAGYRYDQPKSEGALADDILTKNLVARRAGINEGAAQLGRQALRIGQGGSISRILQEADKLYGTSLEGATAGARTQAAGMQPQIDAAHQNKYLPAIQQFARLMDTLNSTQQMPSDQPQRQDALDQALSSGQQGALSRGASGVGGAYSDLAQTASRAYPDLSGIAAALSKLGSQKQDQSTFSAPLFDPGGDPYSVDANRTTGNSGGTIPEGYYDFSFPSMTF